MKTCLSQDKEMEKTIFSDEVYPAQMLIEQ